MDSIHLILFFFPTPMLCNAHTKLSTPVSEETAYPIYTYLHIMATMRSNKPIASTKAKPRMA